MPKIKRLLALPGDCKVAKPQDNYRLTTCKLTMELAPEKLSTRKFLRLFISFARRSVADIAYTHCSKLFLRVPVLREFRRRTCSARQTKSLPAAPAANFPENRVRVKKFPFRLRLAKIKMRLSPKLLLKPIRNTRISTTDSFLKSQTNSPFCATKKLRRKKKQKRKNLRR